MEPTAYTKDTEATIRASARRSRKPSSPATDEIPKTPESELMTVEEYFGILRKRINDYYEGLQG